MSVVKDEAYWARVAAMVARMTAPKDARDVAEIEAVEKDEAKKEAAKKDAAAKEAAEKVASTHNIAAQKNVAVQEPARQTGTEKTATEDITAYQETARNATVHRERVQMETSVEVATVREPFREMAAQREEIQRQVPEATTAVPKVEQAISQRSPPSDTYPPRSRPTPPTSAVVGQKRGRDPDSNRSTNHASGANSPDGRTTPPDRTVGASSTSTMSRISKKPRSDSTASLVAVPTGPCSSVVQGLPDWYTNPKKPKARQNDRQLSDRLSRIGAFIKECKKPEVRQNPQELGKALDNVREELHSLEFRKVNEFAIAKAHLLDNDRGLPQIFKPEFSGGVAFPLYLQDDATLLFTRWSKRIFEQDLFRGIDNMIKSKDPEGKGISINPVFKEDWRYFGKERLVNGQWWGSQLCAVRDGAHGSAQGGIAGIKGKGATSIVLSGDSYRNTDRDEGDEIWYSGTTSSANSQDPTEGTQSLLDSIGSKNPVRVMRSAKLPKSNQFRPKKGFRFDGLYTVLSHSVINESTKHYLFHLRRNPGQASIRYTGVAARPTEQEMSQFDEEMKKYGRRGGVP